MFEHLRKMAERHHRLVGRDGIEIRARILPRGVRVACDVESEAGAPILEEMRAFLEETRALMPIGTLPIEMTFASVPMLASGKTRLYSLLTEVRLSGIELASPKPDEAERSLSALRAMCADLGHDETRPSNNLYRRAGRRDYLVIEAPKEADASLVITPRVNAVGPAGALAKYLAVTLHARALKSDVVLELARSGDLARFSVSEAAMSGDELLGLDAPDARQDTSPDFEI